MCLLVNSSGKITAEKTLEKYFYNVTKWSHRHTHTLTISLVATQIFLNPDFLTLANTIKLCVTCQIMSINSWLFVITKSRSVFLLTEMSLGAACIFLRGGKNVVSTAVTPFFLLLIGLCWCLQTAMKGWLDYNPKLVTGWNEKRGRITERESVPDCLHASDVTL